MEPVTVGIISVFILIILLFSGLHIGVVMGLMGFLGMSYLRGWDAGLGLLTAIPFHTFTAYDLSVVPLFILMGEFCLHGNISGDLYTTGYKLFGKMRGGLAMATVIACAFFAAVCGSSLATSATMSTVALPEMKRYGYDPSLATGVLAAGGTLGILIPPSVAMIIYGMLTEQSIGRLFVAGFIPGVIQTAIFILLIGFLCWRNPNLGPPGPGSTLMEKIKSLKNTWIVILLFLLVIGGIYMGVFGPTEGAGIGAAGAFLFALGRRKLGWKQFKASLVATSKTTAMLFFIVIGAMMLSSFFAVTRLPYQIALMVSGLHMNPYLIWTIIVIIYLFLGCVMDTMGMILLTVPIFYPVMCGPNGLGFDPIWFGIMIVIIVEMALITPPVGMNVFIIKGVAADVPTYTIFKGVMPYVYADIVQIAFYTAFPMVVLWLPNLLKG